MSRLEEYVRRPTGVGSVSAYEASLGDDGKNYAWLTGWYSGMLDELVHIVWKDNVLALLQAQDQHQEESIT